MLFTLVHGIRPSNSGTFVATNAPQRLVALKLVVIQLIWTKILEHLLPVVAPQVKASSYGTLEI